MLGSMSDPRMGHGMGEQPGARFRCVVCRRFVTATERGVCPSCGFRPPTLTPEGRPDPRIWERAARKARAHNDAPRSPRTSLVIALLLSIAFAVLWHSV